MNIQHIHVMTTLGVFIVLILLMVIFPLLLRIKKKQSEIIESLNGLFESIHFLNKEITASDEVIQNNFKEITGKAVIIDTKQTSIKDMLDTIAKGMSIYSKDSLGVIEAIKTLNKGSQAKKSPNKVNVPTRKNSRF